MQSFEYFMGAVPPNRRVEAERFKASKSKVFVGVPQILLLYFQRSTNSGHFNLGVKDFRHRIKTPFIRRIAVG